MKRARWLRALVGFAVAPLVPAVIVSLAYPLSGSLGTLDLFSFLNGVLFFYLFSFAASITAGLPSFVVLNALHLVRWWSATAAGFIIGLVAVAVFPKEQSGSVYMVYSSLGGIAGFVFWLIWSFGAHDAQQGVPADVARPAGERRG